MLYRKGANAEIVDIANEVLRIDSSHPQIGTGERR
jgi:hypothetical protein